MTEKEVNELALEIAWLLALIKDINTSTEDKQAAKDRLDEIIKTYLKLEVK